MRELIEKIKELRRKASKAKNNTWNMEDDAYYKGKKRAYNEVIKLLERN